MIMSPMATERVASAAAGAKFLAAVLAQSKVKKLLSSDHFSVDGTLIEAWASMKSVKPKDGSKTRPRDLPENWFNGPTPILLACARSYH